MKLHRPFEQVPLDLGNKIAWWLFLAACGFALGWVAATIKWTGALCYCAV